MSEQEKLKEILINSFSEWVRAAFPIKSSNLSEELQQIVIQGFIVNLDTLINLVKKEN